MRILHISALPVWSMDGKAGMPSLQETLNGHVRAGHALTLILPEYNMYAEGDARLHPSADHRCRSVWNVLPRCPIESILDVGCGHVLTRMKVLKHLASAVGQWFRRGRTAPVPPGLLLQSSTRRHGRLVRTVLPGRR